MGLESWQQDDPVVAGQPARQLPMELVHQVRYSLPHSRLCAAHLAALAPVGFLGSAADEVVQPVAEALDAPEGVVAELAAVGFGKVGEKGANAGVERHYAITAWGLDVALRRVRNDEPVSAALLHQSAFFVLRRDGFGHPQWSEHGVIDAVLRHGVVWNVAGLLGVLPAAVAELGELFIGSVALCLVCLEFHVEGLDVAHGPAGVPDCGALHLVGNEIPLGM